MQAKSIVNALIQDSPKFMVTFQDHHLFSSGLPGFEGCCKTCRTSTHHNHIIKQLAHCLLPPCLVRPTKMAPPA
ncbi:hypothetical protein EVA_09412 [gut metagenome]|uniref:Uncharacterized protein n=1 Tax=gut metagenome TaxID=749906 RepID=J9CQP7_9ZZZZ